MPIKLIDWHYSNIWHLLIYEHFVLWYCFSSPICIVSVPYTENGKEWKIETEWSCKNSVTHNNHVISHSCCHMIFKYWVFEISWIFYHVNIFGLIICYFLFIMWYGLLYVYVFHFVLSFWNTLNFYYLNKFNKEG